MIVFTAFKGATFLLVPKNIKFQRGNEKTKWTMDYIYYLCEGLVEVERSLRLDKAIIQLSGLKSLVSTNILGSLADLFYLTVS